MKVFYKMTTFGWSQGLTVYYYYIANKLYIFPQLETEREKERQRQRDRDRER